MSIDYFALLATYFNHTSGHLFSSFSPISLMVLAMVTRNGNQLIELINNPIITTNIKGVIMELACISFFFYIKVKLEIAVQRVSRDRSSRIGVRSMNMTSVMILFQSCPPFYRNCWRTSTKRSSNWKQFVFACNSAKMRSYISLRSRCLPERYVYYPRSRYSFSLHLFLLFSTSHASSSSLSLSLSLCFWFYPRADWSSLVPPTTLPRTRAACASRHFSHPRNCFRA